VLTPRRARGRQNWATTSSSRKELPRQRVLWASWSPRQADVLPHGDARGVSATRAVLPDLIENGKLFSDIGLPPFDPAVDRIMICGSPSMLKDLVEILEKRGFVEGTSNNPGDYVIERAFVEK
jgi:ferredoxin-NADP reductase